jgi:hypothetical protein
MIASTDPDFPSEQIGGDGGDSSRERRVTVVLDGEGLRGLQALQELNGWGITQAVNRALSRAGKLEAELSSGDQLRLTRATPAGQTEGEVWFL